MEQDTADDEQYEAYRASEFAQSREAGIRDVQSAVTSTLSLPRSRA